MSLFSLYRMRKYPVRERRPSDKGQASKAKSPRGKRKSPTQIRQLARHLKDAQSLSNNIWDLDVAVAHVEGMAGVNENLHVCFIDLSIEMLIYSSTYLYLV